MKDPHRDLPRVIIFGIPLVILCYMLSNVAYLAALRPEVVMHTNTISMDFGKKIFGPAGGIIFAVCVALSCFGVEYHKNKLPSFFSISLFSLTFLKCIVCQCKCIHRSTYYLCISKAGSYP